MIHNINVNSLENLFQEAVNYAEKNEIKKIVLFAKGKDNVLVLREKINDKDMSLLVTTFPMNQVLYIENEEGEVEEIFPSLYDLDEQMILKEQNITVLSATLPLDSIIIPSHNNNPYDVIKRTLNLFGPGIDLIIQSAMMSTDMGATKPGERIISMNTKSFVDLNTTNSKYMFHPEKKVRINNIFK